MKLTPIEKPKISFLGPSKDYRTNTWSVICTCGYQNKPPTTILSSQVITCGHCEKEWRINYNTLEIVEIPNDEVSR